MTSPQCTAKPTSRAYSLDAARGIAAISVVVWHWQHFFYQEAIADGFQQQRQPFYYNLRHFYDHGGGLAVTFFYVLSGFVFFWMYNDRIREGSCGVAEFSIARIARLYPLHIATLLLVLILQAVYFNTHNTYFVYKFNDLRHFLLNLLCVSSWGLQRGMSYNGPFWSVSVEIGLYVMFFILASCKQSSLPQTLLIATVSGILVRLGVLPVWTSAMEAFFVGGLTWYVTGIWAMKKSRMLTVCLSILCLFVWIGVLCDVRMRAFIFYRFHLFIWMLCPLSIAVLYLLESKYGYLAERFAWIGDITYSTYLLHFPLQLLAVLMTDYIGLPREIYYTRSSFVVFFLVLLAASVLSFRLFERPVQKRIRGAWASRI